MAKTNKALADALALAASLAKKTGTELPPVSANIDELLQQARSDDLKVEAKREESLISFEGMLIQAHHKHALMVKTCTHCGLKFQSSYCYVSYCSDTCRRTAFEEKYGIAWGALKPPVSYWEQEKPIIVPPKDLEKLYSWAKHLVDQYESNSPDGDSPERRALATTYQTVYREEKRAEILTNPLPEILELLPFEPEPVAEVPEVPEIPGAYLEVEDYSPSPANPPSTLDSLLSLGVDFDF